MPTGLNLFKKEPSEAAPPDASLGARFLGLLRRNPRSLQTLVREIYRQNLGIDLDRRSTNGYSGLPANLNLNLTRRCNLNCLMCMQQRQSSDLPAKLSWLEPGRELPLDAWVALLEQVKSFRPRLYVTGGEPLLYPYFTEFLQEAKKRGFLVHLQTNGTRLAKVADLLVDLGVEMVNVSVDGPSEVHDHIRGQAGAFQRTQLGIQALVEARRKRRRPGPILVINCVISKDNLTVLDQMVPLARSLQADILQLQHPIFNSPENIERHNAVLSPELAKARSLDLISPSIFEREYYQSQIGPDDLPLLVASLEKARHQAQRFKLILFPHLSMELIRPYYLDLDYPFPQVCKALWKTGRIFPDGTVSPCLHVIVGSITEQPFKDIWNGPRMRRFREMVGQRLFPGCARCCNRCFT